jgi:hypothetical protein
MYWHHQACVKSRLLMADRIEDKPQSKIDVFSNSDEMVFVLII